MVSHEGDIERGPRADGEDVNQLYVVNLKMLIAAIYASHQSEGKIDVDAALEIACKYVAPPKSMGFYCKSGKRPYVHPFEKSLRDE